MLSPHIATLHVVPRIGPKRLRELSAAFQRESELMAANVDELNAVVRDSRAADSLRRFLDDDLSVMIAGKRHVALWNKTSQKLVKGCVAPTEEKLDAFLSKHPNHEVYTGQDRAEKSMKYVPRAERLDVKGYVVLNFPCADEDKKFAMLCTHALEYGLCPEPREHATELLEAVHRGLRTPTRIEQVRVHAAGALGVPSDEPRAKLNALRADECRSKLRDAHARCLRALHEAKLLPLRLLTPAEGKRRVLVMGEHVPDGPMPICLYQLDDDRFGLLVKPGEDGSLVGPTPRAAADAASEVPPLKHELARALKATESLLDEVASSVIDSSIVEAPRLAVRELLQRTRSSVGYEACLVGMNGIGKSTLANALLYLSSKGDVAYGASSIDDYQLEGLLDSGHPRARDNEDNEVPPFAELLRNDELRAHWALELLEPSDTDVQRSADAASQRERQLREHNLADRRSAKNPFETYVLPCGDQANTTTAVATSLRYGQVMQLSVHWWTHAEMQERAFEYVKMRRSVDFDQEANEVRLAYAQYKMVTTGTLADDSSLALDDDALDDELPASAHDVRVCDEIATLVKQPYRTFVGGGKSLHLDQLLVHAKLRELMRSRSVGALAVRRVTIYQPCTVLEGGNGLVDLPGLNTASPLEQLQTHAAVTHGSTGAVIVVLSRSLGGDQEAMKKLNDYGVLEAVLLRRMRVDFVFNREYVHRGLLPSQLSEEGEMRICTDLITSSRETYKRQLLAKRKQLERMLPQHTDVPVETRPHAGERWCTDIEIDELVRDTRMLPVYVLLHTSAALNRRERPDRAALADKHSGMLTLLGMIEELNHSALLGAIAQLCNHTLPQLRGRIASTLDDSSSQIPLSLVDLATKMLKPRNDAFQLALDSVQSAVRERFEEAKIELRDVVANYFRADPSVYDELTSDAARHKQQCCFDRFRKTANSALKAINAIEPAHGGNYHGLELMPIAFPTGTLGDYEELMVRIDPELDDLFDSVLIIVIEEMSKLHSDALEGSTSQQLLQTVYAHGIHMPLMSRRADFFRARQRAPDLLPNRPINYITKLILRERSVALRATVLTEREACDVKTALDVFALIRSSCLTPSVPIGDHAQATAVQGPSSAAGSSPVERKVTRAQHEWILCAEKKVSDLLDLQLKWLLNDLLGHRVKGRGLLHNMLASFLTHVVQTSTLAANGDARARLGDQARVLDEHVAALRALHALGAAVRLDAAQLGHAIAHSFESMLQQKDTDSRALQVHAPTHDGDERVCGFKRERP